MSRRQKNYFASLVLSKSRLPVSALIFPSIALFTHAPRNHIAGVLNVPHAMPADGDDGGACAYDDDYDEGDGFVDDDDDDVVPNEGPNDGAGDVTAAVSHAPSTPAARRGTTAQSSRAADTVWTRLDAHDASAARGQRQPIRKIKSYRIPSHLNALDDAPTGDNVTGKKKKPTLLCPLSQFCSEACEYRHDAGGLLALSISTCSLRCLVHVPTFWYGLFFQHDSYPR